MKTIRLRWMFVLLDLAIGVGGMVVAAGGMRIFGVSVVENWRWLLALTGIFTVFAIVTHCVALSKWVVSPLTQAVHSPGAASSPVHEIHEFLSMLSANMIALHTLTCSMAVLLQKESNQDLSFAGVLTLLEDLIRHLTHNVHEIEHVLANFAQGDLSSEVPKSLVHTDLGKMLRLVILETRQAVVKLRKEIRHISAVSARITAMSRQGVRNADMETNAVERISSSIYQVAENLRTVIEEIASQRNSLDLTVTAIEKTMTSTGQINSRIESLATAADATAVSIKEIHDVTRAIESQAQSLMQIAETVSTEAKDGLHAVSNSIEGIHTIKRTVEDAGTAIQRLGNESDRIGEILEVINAVAEQTNLLALNASIIAAQAGARGRGFSVVAAEIKALANRTKTSTTEIAGIIRSVQAEVSQGMSAMKRCLQAVGQGVGLANQSGTVLEKIVQRIQTVKEMSVTMATATTTQTANSQMVKDSTYKITEQLDDIFNLVKVQASESSHIAEAANFLQQVTQHIEQAVTLQQHETDAIVRAIEDIRRLVHTNTEMTHRLAHASDELGALEGKLVENMGQIFVTKHRLPERFDPKKPAVAFVRRGTQRFYDDICQGILQSLLAEDIQFIILDSKSNPVVQAESVRWLLRQDWLKGIILSPADEYTGRHLVTYINDAGIPVVVIDSYLDNAETSVVSDNAQGGRSAADMLREYMDDGDHVLVFGSRGSSTIGHRIDGFINQAKSYSWDVVEFFSPLNDLQLAKTSIVEGLMLIPETRGIFLTNETIVLAYLDLLQNGQITQPQLYTIGFDMTAQIFAAINAGYLLGTITQDPLRIGSIAIRELLPLIRRQDTNKRAARKEVLIPVKSITRDSLRSA